MGKSAIVVSGLTLFAAAAAFGQDADVRVVVGFHGAPDASAITDNGGRVGKTLSGAHALAAVVPASAVERVRSLAHVAYVEEDAVLTTMQDRARAAKPPGGGGGGGGGGTTPPPQPPQEIPWGVDRIGANLAWPTTRGAGIKVAIVDTGIKLDHPDLAANIGAADRYNAVNPAKPANDDNGHGTHVAGTVAAVDNDIGVVGVAPSAGLMAVKVLSKTGSGFLSDVVEGIDWSVANGAKVINMSLGSTSQSQSLKDSCDAAFNAGVVVVAAAGNSGETNSPSAYLYPASFDSVISVAATDINNVRASFSTYNDKVELAAPGKNILSATYDGLYGEKSGTSMATPHVSGAAALAFGSLWADKDSSGTVTHDEVRAALQATADDLGLAGKDVEYGYGLVDADQAVLGPDPSSP